MAVGGKGEGVVATSGDGHDVGETAGAAGSFHFDRRGGVGRRSVAQLAVSVIAPGIDVAVGGQGEGVVAPAADCGTWESPLTDTGCRRIDFEPLPSWPSR